jgi:hypothetical protein
MSNKFNQEELLEQAALLATDLYADQMLSNSSSLLKTSRQVKETPEFKQIVLAVEKELKKNVLTKKAICAVLGSAKNDIREVTKIVGAAILPLALSGVIVIPITPFAFAVAGLFVFNAGITAFCSGFLKNEKD